MRSLVAFIAIAAQNPLRVANVLAEIFKSHFTLTENYENTTEKIHVISSPVN
jgi:hypothetical protein